MIYLYVIISVIDAFQEETSSRSYIILSNAVALCHRPTLNDGSSFRVKRRSILTGAYEQCHLVVETQLVDCAGMSDKSEHQVKHMGLARAKNTLWIQFRAPSRNMYIGLKMQVELSAKLCSIISVLPDK